MSEPVKEAENEQTTDHVDKLRVSIQIERRSLQVLTQDDIDRMVEQEI